MVSSFIFERRELPAEIDRVREESLQLGETYFRIGFVDPNFAVPSLEPVVFIGRDLFDGETGFYFQDALSYHLGFRLESDEDQEEAGALIYHEESGRVHVYDFENALNELLLVSLRRKATAQSGGALSNSP